VGLYDDWFNLYEEFTCHADGQAFLSMFVLRTEFFISFLACVYHCAKAAVSGLNTLSPLDSIVV
jgi:hypothetical protein